MYRTDCSRNANLEYWESTYKFVKGLHAGGGQEDAELQGGTLQKGKIAACRKVCVKTWKGTAWASLRNCQVQL